MLDWLGKMLELPAEFLACSGGKGGGVIQGTASEATLVALLGAKAKMMKKVKEEHPDWEDSVIIPKLVGYCSGTNFKYFLVGQMFCLFLLSIFIIISFVIDNQQGNCFIAYGFIKINTELLTILKQFKPIQVLNVPVCLGA